MLKIVHEVPKARGVGTGWGKGWKRFSPRWVFLVGLQRAYGCTHKVLSLTQVRRPEMEAVVSSPGGGMVWPGLSCSEGKPSALDRPSGARWQQLRAWFLRPQQSPCHPLELVGSRPRRRNLASWEKWRETRLH